MAECGTCKQCCITYPLLPNADYWPDGKPTHTPCKHVCEKGCAIHDQPRPNVCTRFRCLWLNYPKIGDQMRPDKSGLLMTYTTLRNAARTALDRFSIGDKYGIQINECWPEALLCYDPDKLRWMFRKIPERKAQISAIVVHPYNFTFDYNGIRMNEEFTFGVSVKHDDEASKGYADKLMGWWRGEVPHRKRVTLCLV